MAKPFTDTANTIIEEREELIISPIGDSKPILRTAHFLKPIISSIDEPDLPAHNVSFSLPPTHEPIKRPLRITFGAWRHRRKEWNEWVFHMHSTHHSAWEKAGICKAILSSTYEIPRYDNLIFGLAEYWCPNTNTFIFPWAEATITLEDVMVLGDYPVLGSPVSCSVQKMEWKRIENKLKEARSMVCKTKAKKACQYMWMRNFIQCGTEIEHEAFLSMWLSRFVLQNPAETVRKNVFPMAISLARGSPVALAPAVLASIYRDLSRLNAIINSAKFSTAEDVNNELILKIRSPFQLVQIWAWERFQAFQPNPKTINRGDPRLSRWNMVRYPKIDNVGLALASAGENFIWRPYSKLLHNRPFPSFYNEKEEWLCTDLCLDKDLESFACCLRVSKLVGLGFMENYFPHRVAMQFGFDQDIPGHIDQSDETSEVAWTNYSRPIGDSKFYIPSRLFQSGVTPGYLKWWKQLILDQQQTNKIYVQRYSIKKRKNRDSVEEDNTEMQRLKTDQQASKKKKKRVPDAPPGFHSKCNMVNLMKNSHVEDKQTGEETLNTCKKSETFRKRGAFENIDKLFGESHSSSSSFTHDKTARKRDSMPKLEENILHSVRSSQRGMEACKKATVRLLSGNEGEDSSDGVEIPGLALEARIRNLETEITKLKAARFGIRFN